MTWCFHYIPFIHYDILLLVLHYYFFIYHFHCIEIPVFLESAQIHFWKSTWTYQLYDLETVKRKTFSFINTSFFMSCFQIKWLSIQKLTWEMSLHKKIVKSDLHRNCFEVTDFRILFLEIRRYISYCINFNIMFYFLVTVNHNNFTIFSLLVLLFILF